MKIGPREQILIVAVGVVVVLLAIGAFLVWPQIQKLGTLDQQITAARAQVNASEALLQQRVAVKDRAADTDAQLQRLADLVPDGPDLPSLIIELQDAAFASGVQVVGITPNAPTSTTGQYYAIPVSIDIIGTWADTVDYMQRLMRLNRGLRIVETSTLTTDNSAQSAKENETLPDYAVTTTIKLEAYMIPSSATPPTTPATGR